MRNVSSLRDKKLQAEQIEVFVALIDLTSKREDIELFLKSFLTKSEMAYFGQRLNIIRMLIKGFSYQKIQEMLRVRPGTIANAKKRLESGGDNFKKIVGKYRLERQINHKRDQEESILSADIKIINTRIPGSIF
jgi:uncharacterized protein YerC